MAGTQIGSAEFLLLVNQQGLIVGMAQAEQTARQSSAKIASSIDGNLKRAEQSASRFGQGFGSALKIGAAITGVTLGLEAVHAGLVKVAEQTQKNAQAQFALNKIYGDGAAQYRAFAQELAKTTGRSATDFETASVKAATLAKNYGLASAQIQELIKRSADLAAVHGKEVPDAAERVIAAIRGEAEAAEALGLTLNSDAVKAFAAMTDEQRRNFESLDQATKAQIIYRELLRQTNDVQGAAVERANSALGAFDKLTTATNKLAATIGQALLPGVGQLAGIFADAINGATGLIEQMTRLQALGEGDGLKRLAAIVAAMSGNLGPLAGQIAAGAFAPTPASEAPTLGPSPDEVRAAQTAANAERKRQVKEQLDDARKAADARADFEIAGLEKEKQAVERHYAARRVQVEKAKDAEIKAAEDARDGAIRAIEEQARAVADAYERQIREAQAARDALQQAAEDNRDSQIRALEATQQAAQDANSAQIRDQEIARDRARRAAEDRRDVAIKALDEEKRARDNARVLEDRAREDEQRDTLRAIEAQHDAAVRALADQVKAVEAKRDRAIRAIEREAERAQAAARAALGNIDRQAAKEDDRHRRALQNLSDEQDARLAILDAQLKALDAQERAADQAERMVNLQRRLADAQQNLARAQGTGTAEQIAEAREELVRALKLGSSNEVGIANARERLRQLAGEGAEAVKAAQQEVADAESDVQKERTDAARDGERERLNAAKDAVRAEIEAKKRTEDEDNRRRERQLAAERDAAEKGLKARIDALEKRKRASQDAAKAEIDDIRERQDQEKGAHDLAVQQARDVAEQAKRAIEDRRRSEDQADQDKRRQIADTYGLEQEQIRATYDDEATGIIPALRRAREASDREFAARRQTIQDAYEEEQRQIKATYDDPINGVLAKLREQAEAARREYDARKTAVNAAYQAERDRISEVYDDPENGLFAQLEKSKQATLDALNDQVLKWRQWKSDVVEQINDALGKLDEFIKRVGSLGDIRVPGPDDINDRGGVGASPYGPQIPRGSGGDLAYGPVVRNASADSYWTSGGTHGGHPAADIFAPKGSGIYAPVGGTLSSYQVSAGGNAATLIGDDGRAYYFAHGNVPFVNGRVEQGQQIGEVGDTGNARGTTPHLHFAIASDASLFSRYNGSGDIDGDASYWGSGGRVNTRGATDEFEIELFGQKLRIRTQRGGGNYVGPNGGQGEAFNRLLQQAQGAARKYDLPAAIMAAIPINEGLRSQLQTQYKNLFSIKGTGPAGSVNLPTEEVINGQRVLVNSPFRVYNSESESFEDFGRLVTQSGIYDDAVRVWRETRDPRKFMQELGKRYATDPNFPAQVLRIAGYRNGGVIGEPSLLYGLRSGRLATMAEAGPERILSAEQTRAYRGDGASYGGDTVNFYGLTYEQAAVEQRRQQHRDKLLRGVSTLGRRR